MQQAPAREPILLAPTGLLLAIAALIAIHAYRAFWLDPWSANDVSLLKSLAFVPARLSLDLGLVEPADLMRAALERPPAEQGLYLFLARNFALQGGSGWWTLFSHALVHGSWQHVVLNGFWFLAFGAPVMRRIGAMRFCLLFLVATAAGALLFMAVQPEETAILIGASGGISGLTGAVARFAVGSALFSPAVAGAPLKPLAAAFRDRGIVVFVAVWMGLNLITGLASPFAGIRIAWEAHLGGFLVGLFLFPLFDRRQQRI